jgi:hypothetical protein
MRPLKVVKSLVKDEPLNIEERFERLELETNRKLEQLEEVLGVFRDVVVKLHEEKEQLEAENTSLRNSITNAASDFKDAVVKPLEKAGEDFIELLAENTAEQREPKIVGNPVHSSYNPNSDEMARTISWMREKFGLPASKKTEAKRVSKKKK